MRVVATPGSFAFCFLLGREETRTSCFGLLWLRCKVPFGVFFVLPAHIRSNDHRLADVRVILVIGGKTLRFILKLKLRLRDRCFAVNDSSVAMKLLLLFWLKVQSSRRTKLKRTFRVALPRSDSFRVRIQLYRRTDSLVLSI
jgi:hypothetical protein